MVVVVACVAPRAGLAGPLNPNSFSLSGSGVFPTLAGNYTINTSSTSNPTFTGPGGTSITGTYFQDSPGHTLAVFVFSSINVAAGEIIAASGAVPLVLLSQGDATIAGTINGNASLVNFQAAGGPGGGSLGSAGPGGATQNFGNGGGGGFGGSGGSGGVYTGNSGTVIPSSPGGGTYGNLLNSLQGGSSGGGTSAAGGGIEIGAVGNVHLLSTGVVEANGLGATSTSFGSGGGSGGGIFLHGDSIVADTGALISASGGSGAPAVFVPGTGGGSGGGGGGGGGGRVLLEDSSTGYIQVFPNQINVSGGAGGSAINGTSAGSSGTIDALSAPAIVPEPGSLMMVATALVIGLGWNHRRTSRPGAR